MGSLSSRHRWFSVHILLTRVVVVRTTGVSPLSCVRVTDILPMHVLDTIVDRYLNIAYVVTLTWYLLRVSVLCTGFYGPRLRISHRLR